MYVITEFKKVNVKSFARNWNGNTLVLNYFNQK